MVMAHATPVGFVHVSSVERAREFYVERLGLVIVEESPFALVVQTGPIVLRLTPVEHHVAAEGTVFGWVVEDVNAAMDALLAAGVSPLRFPGLDQDARGIWRSPSSAQIGWFADHDGNTLSVTEL
jgi:catechol 2,3-dioxygenase-like lactoylglutathione lyase family enzyme